MATDDVVSKKTRLVDNYPQAYSDFYPSRAHCVYKSGPVWPVRNGPGTPWRGVQREVRPVHAHAIGTAWLSIGKRIYEYLDSARVKWTSINPLAYANAGDAKPFCPLVITIGVKPNSLLYEAAITASTAVKEILAGGGFPDIEVAFVESVVTRSVAGPKLLSFDPLFNKVPNLRKPFTTALGLSIAPLKYPHFEGTAALYFRLNKDDNRTAILTCAHVARPPHVYRNTGITRKSGQRREEVVALGSTGYSNAVKAMMSTIARLVSSIEIWNDARDRLGEPVEGENCEVTERRQDYVDSVAKARRTIEKVNAMHSEVTKHRSIPDLRVIGFVLHSEKIEVSVDPYGFTKDWALIELYDEKIDWATFKGNKVYVGGNFSIGEYSLIMYPQPVDEANYPYPQDGLLQAYGVVQDDEMRNPQHIDVHGEKCLLVVKDGLTTGTTIGRTNGLESFTRTYEEYGVNQTSIEFAVLPYDTKRAPFSERGDSGSIVVARDGRIVGILTGGAGPIDETDISYITPYWWVEKEIKAKYPGCFLYDVVN